MTADIEHAVISQIVLTEDIKHVMDVRLTSKFFTDIEHRRVFELVLDHFHDHKKTPDETTIQRAFPKYEIDQYPEPLSYYVNELQDRYIYRSLVTGLSEVGDLISDDGPNKGEQIYDALSEVLLTVRHEVPAGKDEDMFGTAREYLLPELEARRKYGYLRGIPTGFESVDRATRGYQPEQLVFLVGLPKSGKSWVHLYSAITTRLHGSRLLYFTFEMSIEEERDRLACLVANVPYSNILTGSLLPQEKDRLELTLRRMENLEGFTMIHDRAAMTLDKINQKIVEYQPDAVFIDGVYFMEDQYGEPPGTPRALTNITRGLKKMAQNHRIPVIATTQALAHKLRRGELQAESIGYSSSFLQDADVILGVERMTDEISRYKVLLSRSGPLTETYIKRDLNAGTLEEIDKAIVLSLTQQDGGSNDGGVI